MSIWSSWRTSRLVSRGAERYAGLAWTEPEEEVVAWLARDVAGGDDDRARWELRYLRRAIAQLVAERDGWDDRVGAAVARELADRLRHDPAVAEGRLGVAERQFDVRLSRYREALLQRTGGSLSHRLAVGLLHVAAPGRPPARGDGRLEALVELEIASASARLKECFGQPELPDDVRPSQLAGGD